MSGVESKCAWRQVPLPLCLPLGVLGLPLGLVTQLLCLILCLIGILLALLLQIIKGILTASKIKIKQSKKNINEQK